MDKIVVTVLHEYRQHVKNASPRGSALLLRIDEAIEVAEGSYQEESADLSLGTLSELGFDVDNWNEGSGDLEVLADNMELLAKIARCKALALNSRRQGNVEQARSHERELKNLYNRLHQEVRW